MLPSAISLATKPPPHMTVTSISPPIASHFFILFPPLFYCYSILALYINFYKISRQKAAEFIRAGHVKVNHKPVEQINYLCNNKDIISFKKHGRVMFVDCNKQTRSDNYVVEGYFYK